MDQLTTDISVIVPTYNGLERIRKCLLSIFSQSSLPAEVIVVIDGPGDGTYEFLHQEYREKIKIISQENTGRAATRNAGVEKANSAVLLFVDDDIELEPDAIQKHVDHHEAYKNSILVGGIFLKSGSGRDFHKYRQHIERIWYKNLPDYPYPMQANQLFVTAANLSMPGKLFEGLNGFDPGLRDCEDIEFGYRAVNAGVEIYFDHRITGWHNDFLSCKQYIKRRREYDIAQKQLIESNPLYKSYRNDQKGSVWIKQGIYNAFSSKRLVRWIDANYLNWMPEIIRYRFYSAVVWALSHYHPTKPI